MTQAQPAGRLREAGVTLIEMLVVLALFAVVAGAVVMALPARGTSASAEAGAARFASDLNHAVALALSDQRGFGIAVEDNTIRIVQKAGDGRWQPHSDAGLAQVKLFPAGARILDQAHRNGVAFEVSERLLPLQDHPLEVQFGNTDARHIVHFDGLAVQLRDGG